jgi:uridylate kinase
MIKTPYKRLLIKLSGESLLGHQAFGINQEACLKVAHFLQGVRQNDIEIAIVIGGGNIFRGIDLRATGIPRTPADHMGMLATLLNGLAIQQSLISIGSSVCVMSALECPRVAEAYNWGRALQYLSEGKILIFVGGTGNPYFTTDTAAGLRACEMKADILVKATKVDGVYNKDPLKYSDAVKYQKISYSDMLAEKLQVMDATAVALCRSSQIPIFVCQMQKLLKENIGEWLNDLSHGTLIDGS